MKKIITFMVVLMASVLLIGCVQTSTIKITLDVNGGNPLDETTIKLNKGDALELPVPTKDDQAFLGWYTADDIKYQSGDIVNKSLKLIAKWGDGHAINYDLDGGTLLSELNMYSEEALPLELPAAEKLGHTFKGWRLNGKIVTSIPEETSGAIDLVAVWQLETYTITYLLDGGVNNGNNGRNYDVTELPKKLWNPTKDGYIFKNWQLDGVIVTEIPANTTGNITLTASWEKEPNYYNIVYNLRGGVFENVVEINFIEGSNITLAIPTRNGHEFAGWYDNIDFEGDPITEITNLSDNINIYAKWDEQVIYHNISYILNGGHFVIEPDLEYKQGEEVTLPIPVRDNYLFLGWYDNEFFTGNPIAIQANTLSTDTKYYAKWEKEIYTINYFLNGGTFNQSLFATRAEMVNAFIADINSYYQVNTTVDNFFEDSYNYSALSNFFNSSAYKDKWTWMMTYIIDIATNTSYSGLTILKTSTDSYYNTYWRANIAGFLTETYRETWPASIDFSNYNNANSYDSYLPGESITVIYEFDFETGTITLPEPFRKDYTFLGWYDEFDQLVTTIPTGTNKNITIYAKWESLYQTYTITYNADGGIMPENTVYTFNELEEIILPNITKRGYTFNGWYLNDDYSGSPVETIAKGTQSNVVLYASFSIINYKIEYNLAGGNFQTTPITSYNVLSETFELLFPVRANYIFVGWFTDGGVMVSEIEQGTIGNQKLTARWEKYVDPGTIFEINFFDVNGNLVQTQNVQYGNKLQEISAGSGSELELAWFSGYQIYDFNQPVYSEFSLHARWAAIGEILEEIFEPELFDNLTIRTTYMTMFGTMTVYFTTDDSQTVNGSSGVVNPLRELTYVTITGTFTYKTYSQQYSFTLPVKPVTFGSLADDETPVFAYVYSNTSSFALTDAALGAIDVINYGFARVSTSGIVDTSGLSQVNRVIQARKVGIRVLLCIGGYNTAGKEFSDAASTPEGRTKLANSILETIEKYHYDGVDIDWEYPGYGTGRDVSIDRPNYTLLMTEIRRVLKAANPDYLITAATPGGKYSYVRYELNKLGNILDYCLLMTYDLQDSNKTTHHTALYTNSYTPHGSVEQTVTTYINSGMPKSKLVVGIAFYGRYYVVNNPATGGIGSSNISRGGSSITYSRIYAEYISKITSTSSIQRYWDATAKAPYIYDTATGMFISYDDAESIKAKAEYTKSQGLGGMMFWDYGEDNTGQLIQAIYDYYVK